MPNIHYNDAGTWKKIKKLHYNDAGTWKKIKKAYQNVGGTWKLIYSGAAEIHYLYNSANVTSGNTATYNNVAIGDAASDRNIIVAVGARGGTGVATTNVSVTINGVSAPEISGTKSTLNASFIGSQSSLYSLVVNSGTTANIVVSSVANFTTSHIAVYSVLGAQNTTPSSVNVAAPGVTNSSVITLGKSDGSVVLSYNYSPGDGSNNITWTSVTEDFEYYLSSPYQVNHSGASVLSTNSDNIVISSNNASIVRRHLCGVTFT